MQTPATQVAIPEPICFGDLTLDVMKRKVLCKERSLRLDNQEYKVLSYLITCAEVHLMCRKDDLYQHLYQGTSSEPEGNVLNVFVCRIRKKLKNAESICSIKTVHSKGYELHSNVVQT